MPPMCVRFHGLRAPAALIAWVCLLFPSASFCAAWTGPGGVQSPLRPVGPAAGGVATRLVLDVRAFEGIRSLDAVVLEDFALGEDRQVDVALRRFDVFTQDAIIVLGTADGNVALPRPDIAMFSGQVVGEPDTSVFLGLSRHDSAGLIRLTDETFVISAGPPGLPEGATVVYNLTTLPPGTIDWRDFTCRADELPAPPGGGLESLRAPGGSPRGDAPCRIADIAVETDWEFTGWLFGGDTDASAAYAAILIGAVSEIYTRDVNSRLQISFLRVWPTNDDPWNQGNTIDQLFQFQDYWNANMTDVQRHAAHFLSGRGLGGGVAYLPGLCYPEYDYGLSANLNGFFPYPLEHNHGQNWDPYVVAHELGHNFGAPHTHDMNPPIDGCAWGDCSDAQNGTIMSYCHTCPGGVSNIRLEFHPRTIDEAILPYLDDEAMCDITADPPTIVRDPADQAGCLGGAATFAVTAEGDGALVYQWRRDGLEIPGASGSSYTIEPLTFEDAGEYDVIVSNDCGSTVSAAATLDVWPVGGGDVNGDGLLNGEDIAAFLDAMLGEPDDLSGEGVCAADMNGDGLVNLEDIELLVAGLLGG